MAPNYVVPFQVNSGKQVVVPTAEDIKFPDYSSVSPLFALADMNGDGLPYLVYTVGYQDGFGPEQYYYLPGDGTGRFACNNPTGVCAQQANIYGPAPLAFKDGDAPPPYTSQIKNNSAKQIFFHDVNGDGLADVILVNLRTSEAFVIGLPRRDRHGRMAIRND